MTSKLCIQSRTRRALGWARPLLSYLHDYVLIIPGQRSHGAGPNGVGLDSTERRRSPSGLDVVTVRSLLHSGPALCKPKPCRAYSWNLDSSRQPCIFQLKSCRSTDLTWAYRLFAKFYATAAWNKPSERVLPLAFPWCDYWIILVSMRQTPNRKGSWAGLAAGLLLQACLPATYVEAAFDQLAAGQRASHTRGLLAVLKVLWIRRIFRALQGPYSPKLHSSWCYSTKYTRHSNLYDLPRISSQTAISLQAIPQFYQWA